MKRELMCENCNAINEIELREEYWETDQEYTFQIFKCKDCGTINSINWAIEHRFNVNIADEEDIKDFKDDIEEDEE